MALLANEVPISRSRWLTALVGSVALALFLGTGALAVRSFPLAAAAEGGAGADDTVCKVGGDVQAPVEISRIQPASPEEARKNRVQGEVILEAVIDQKGAVTSLVGVRSPDELLSNAALEAVRKWTYRPATKGGKPVKVLLAVTVAFRLA